MEPKITFNYINHSSIKRGSNLINFLSVTASLGKSSPSSGWLTKHNIAVSAYNNGLCVAEYGGDLEASWALDVHEEAIWALHKALELVCLCLSFWGWVQKIDWHFIIM